MSGMSLPRRERELVAYYDEHPAYYSPLSRLRPMEIAAMLDLEYDHLPGPSLDIGCGDGRLAEHVSGPVYGIDVSYERLKVAADRGTYAHVFQRSVYDLGDMWVAKVPEIRTAYAFEVLEHLEDPCTAIEGILDILTPDDEDPAILLATVPLRLPCETHLQVFEDPAHVRARLQPDLLGGEFTVAFDGGLEFTHVACAWMKGSGS